MNIRIAALFSLIIEVVFLSCTRQTPETFENPVDTRQMVADSIINSSDTPITFESKNYTDVHCMLLINYPTISNGEYVYKLYSIKADSFGFRIERTYRNGQVNYREIPFTKEEKEKYMNSRDSLANRSYPIKFQFGNKRADIYTSSKESYRINQTDYVIYKHIDYNCYDPFCMSKHGHVRQVTGVTYFSPEYGILISKDESNMEFELLKSIKGKEVPYDLIIEIMKRDKMNERVVNTYIRKCKQR
jgi:hypothetical protein